MPEGAALLELLVQHKYALVVPLVFVAQTAVGLAGGFLARLGHLDPGLLYALLVCTALVHDCVVYVAGYRWGEPFLRTVGPYVSITERRVESVKVIFERHHTPILLASKMTSGMGLSAAVLFTAGLTRIPFWRYLTLNFIGEAAWSALLVGVGYFYGSLYLVVEGALGQAALFGSFIAVAVLAIGFGRYWHARLMERLSRE